jgi:hypothetical protein
MPKTLPALVAVAIIAFSIGFNAARYPIVWEMVGPPAHVAAESGGSEAAAAPQSVKADELITSIPRDNPALMSSAGGQALATVYSDQAAAVRAETVGADLSAPMTNLAPVPSDLFNGNGSQLGEGYSGVRRLPPVYEAAPIPAGRYATEYPQSPVTIYPSTGIE